MNHARSWRQELQRQQQQTATMLESLEKALTKFVYVLGFLSIAFAAIVIYGIAEGLLSATRAIGQAGKQLMSAGSWLQDMLSRMEVETRKKGFT